MGLYKVTVATGCFHLSGTIDTISISLIGVNGGSEKKELSHLWFPDTVCDFDVTIEQDVGELRSVELYKDTHVFPVQDHWYCEYVHVTSPDGKLYQFPVYQWLVGQTSVVYPEGTGVVLSGSSGNVCADPQTKNPMEDEELEKKGVFLWHLHPTEVQNSFAFCNVDELFNEQSSELKSDGSRITKILSELDFGIKEFTRSTDSWRELDHINMVFCFNRTKTSNEVSRIWNEDSFFGYQFMNGVNPMLIKKCIKLPENFPVSSSMVASSLGSSTDLDKELENGNIFLADYKVLHEIVANNSINDRQQYIAAPICLLWKDPQDQLLPIAIQLGQTPGKRTPIFLPSDNEWDWTLAKIWVRNADFQVHQTVYYLVHTHLVAEKFNIATHRQLPRNHPVYKLLCPHLNYTLDINTLTRRELFDLGGVLDQIMAVGEGGIERLMQKGMQEVTYSDLCLPDDIAARGLESIPNYYYRDDGKMIWEAIESFVSSIVHFYYKGDESVRSDPQLQAWVNDIYTKGFQKSESSGVPSSLETMSSLVKYVTMVIFRCSAQHAAVKSGQFDFYSWMPNGPSSMKSPPPSAKGVTTLQTVLDALPDVTTTITGLVTVWQLSTMPKDQRPLGYYPDVHFTEKAPQKFIQQFQEKLAEISWIINERNQTRRVPYLYLDPKNIENSISMTPYYLPPGFFHIVMDALYKPLALLS
ncbi:polyunsaturated fatty acid lipoxygenase ALOX15B-like [Anomaloglossus baeobatrachus]|uniref:polyunsaturated fatty acid lipoxygenase ALOX15B-like n=1 Tax=Anomaloglossus baeobatrachus TaxID=238106 RepID=UPI003F4F8C87